MRTFAALVLTAAANLGAFDVAGGQQAVTARPLSFDSTTVRSVLDEALRSAQEAPAAERPGLVNGVGLAQLRARDFAGAERSLSIAEQATPAEVARALGQSLVFVGLDRSDLATKLACTLRDAGRPDEALTIVRRLPLREQREWQLARAAAFAARSKLSAADSAAHRRGQIPNQWRDALALAEEVALPEAKLDALIAVAQGATDQIAPRDVAVAAFDQARRIRLADADRQASRDALLAVMAIDYGRSDQTRDLFGRLSNSEDLQYVFSMAAERHDVRLVRELAPRTIEVGSAIRDSAARFAFLSSVRALLIREAGQSVADDLLPERMVGVPALREPYDSAVARSNQPRDVADRAAGKGDFATARRAVERLPVVDPSATRASLLSDLAWGSYSIYRDSAAALLRLAREALLASQAGSMRFDDLAARIADRQFWIGDDEEGLASLNLIRDPEAANGAIYHWGGSTASSMTADRLRAYADRVRDPRVRDAVLLRVITGYLAVRGAAPSQLDRARHLADSIASPSLAIKGRTAVASSFIQRGDSVRGRAELLSLLADASLPESDAKGSVVGPLARYGALPEALAWARSGDAAQRSRRLVGLADALRSYLDQGRGVVSFSNGPDSCRDVF